MFDAAPLGWRRSKLLDFFQLQRGFDLPVQSRKTGSIPVIASNGQVGFHDHSPIPSPAVVTGRSGTIGKVIFAEEPCWPLNTTLFVSDFKGSDPRYVYYFLQGFPLKEHSSGTGVPTLNRNDVHAVEVCFPPLHEQRRVADVLRSVDEKIIATRTVADQLDTSIRAIIEGFIRSSAGEVDWTPIGQLAVFVGSGVTPKGGKDSYLNAGIPLIRSQNVHFDGLREDGLAFIDAQTDAKMARTRVQSEDVLLNITGASIGRCTTVPKGFGPGNVNQHVCIIRTDRSLIQPAFLAIFLSSHDGQRQIDQLQGGLSREGLNFQQVRAIEVPVPTLDAQRVLIESIASMRAVAALVADDLRKSLDLKSGLMGDLLSGRVRVPA